MKVGELIEKLSKLDKDTPVIMSRDGEGNSFAPCTDAEPCWYRATRFGGDLVHEDDYDPEDAEGVERVVCLWPVG